MNNNTFTYIGLAVGAGSRISNFLRCDYPNYTGALEYFVKAAQLTAVLNNNSVKFPEHPGSNFIFEERVGVNKVAEGFLNHLAEPIEKQFGNYMKILGNPRIDKKVKKIVEKNFLAGLKRVVGRNYPLHQGKASFTVDYNSKDGLAPVLDMNKFRAGPLGDKLPSLPRRSFGAEDAGCNALKV